MAFELHELVSSFITPDFQSETARQLEESPEGIHKAVSAIIPTLLAAFVTRAEAGGADSLLNEAQQVTAGGLTTNLGPLFGNESSFGPARPEFIQELFGNHLAGIMEQVSAFAGIRTSSVQTLFGLLTPVCLVVLGRQAEEKEGGGPVLTSYLSHQKAALVKSIPPGLSLPGITDDATAS